MATTALHVDVRIAQPFVVAGQPFSLTTTFENRHEGPIEVIELLYYTPFQVQWIYSRPYDDTFERFFRRIWIGRMSPLLTRLIWQSALSAPGTTMTFSHTQDPENNPVFRLLPGQAGTYSFSLVLRKWLFATGGDLVFPGLIRYRYNGQICHHTFEVRFSSRPPLSANCLGAVVGSLLGPIARQMLDHGANFLPEVGIPLITSLALTTILSVIAVIYSSRKTSEVQPIITVEDFWGGLLVGFFLGFSGSNMFSDLVPASLRDLQ